MDPPNYIRWRMADDGDISELENYDRCRIFCLASVFGMMMRYTFAEEGGLGGLSHNDDYCLGQYMRMT